VIKLFDPISIRSINFRNRIGVSPMVQTSSNDGFANNWHLVHLGSRAVGGAGLVMTEATAIEKKGRISPNDLGIWKDAHIPKLSEITSFIKNQGSVPGIQLAHAGRKGSYSSPINRKGLADYAPLKKSDGGWEVLGPSNISFEHGGNQPKCMSENDIHKIINSFARAASRANKAGFDFLEIHAAHGYLLHQFYSPVSNKRSDSYGKDFNGRIKLTLEVARATRKVWPSSKVLCFRISFTDWIDGGWVLEDSIELCKKLKKIGVDVIDVSSGGTSSKTVAIAKELLEKRDNVEIKSSIPLEPGYQVHAAQLIKEKAKITTASVGLITDPRHAQNIVSSKKSDFVFLGRELLRDPYWPIRAAQSLNQTNKLSIPGQYYLGWKELVDAKFRGI
jgi:2,4-dienoyl-CoA reductase-like NADH-dependent reductase (Old Yellow Enzyme family)